MPGLPDCLQELAGRCYHVPDVITIAAKLVLPGPDKDIIFLPGIRIFFPGPGLQPLNQAKQVLMVDNSPRPPFKPAGRLVQNVFRKVGINLLLKQKCIAVVVYCIDRLQSSGQVAVFKTGNGPVHGPYIFLDRLLGKEHIIVPAQPDKIVLLLFKDTQEFPVQGPASGFLTAARKKRPFCWQPDAGP